MSKRSAVQRLLLLLWPAAGECPDAELWAGVCPLLGGHDCTPAQVCHPQDQAGDVTGVVVVASAPPRGLRVRSCSLQHVAMLHLKLIAICMPA